MLVVVTGGTGFLGRRLAGALLERGCLTGTSGAEEPIERIVLLDHRPPPPTDTVDERVEVVLGDVADAELLASLVDRDDVSLFHLASLVSAEAEEDFDLAMRVNLDGGRAVLEACRRRGSSPRLVFTSSIAAFGGEAVGAAVSDQSKLTPESTYGTTKAIGELLVNEYSRRGFVDGRSARLPTVVIRPGPANAAASAWVSGIFREPLNGEASRVPVELSIGVPISGYRSVVRNLILLHELDGAALGSDRAVSLPALNLTAAEMLETLRRVADRPLGPIEVAVDPRIDAFYKSWAQRSSFARATALGLEIDRGLDSVIAEYIEDFLQPVVPR